MKILLAIDGSPCSDQAVKEVCKRPWPEDSEVYVITVDAPLPTNLLGGASSGIFDELVKQQRSEATAYLTRAVATIRQESPSLRVRSMLLEGVPKEAIVSEAERYGADLIVVGSNGYGAVQRFFLGSVSLAVATHAPCSVLIVRCPCQAAAGEVTTEA